MNSKKRSLVAYFSCSGVTRRVAQELAAAADADLYEIRPEIPYTPADLDWTDPNSRSSREMNNKSFRPPIVGDIPDLKPYDTLFIGFPIWWYVAPTIINTFLEACKLEGKTIVPFATSGGSGFGNTVAELQVSCPASVVWKEGKLLNGQVSADLLKNWLASL